MSNTELAIFLLDDNLIEVVYTSNFVGSKSNTESGSEFEIQRR